MRSGVSRPDPCPTVAETIARFDAAHASLADVAAACLRYALEDEGDGAALMTAAIDAFLRERFADEAFAFLLAVKRYEAIVDGDYAARAQEIFDLHVAPDASAEVTMPKPIRVALTHEVVTGAPDVCVFNAAAAAAFRDLTKDQMGAFVVLHREERAADPK